MQPYACPGPQDHRTRNSARGERMPIIATLMGALVLIAVYAYAAKRRAEKDSDRKRVQERLDSIAARLMTSSIVTQPEA